MSIPTLVAKRIKKYFLEIFLSPMFPLFLMILIMGLEMVLETTLKKFGLVPSLVSDIGRIVAAAFLIIIYYKSDRTHSSSYLLRKVKSKGRKIVYCTVIVIIAVIIARYSDRLSIMEQLQNYVSTFVGAEKQPFADQLTEYSNNRNYYLVILEVIGVAIAAPLYEEMIFRAFFYGMIRNFLFSAVTGNSRLEKFVRVFSVVLIAIVGVYSFAYAHHGGAFVFAAVFGLVFLLVYEVTGSIWLSILAHVINNTLSVLYVFDIIKL